MDVVCQGKYINKSYLINMHYLQTEQEYNIRAAIDETIKISRDLHRIYLTEITEQNERIKCFIPFFLIKYGRHEGVGSENIIGIDADSAKAGNVRSVRICITTQGAWY